MVSNSRVVAVVVAMFQEDGGDRRVMLQNPNQFRPAITAMSDNANVESQVVYYSLL
jgi:hypothetical protein